LENAVVEVSGDAAALAFDSPGAKVAQEEDVFERGTDVASDALEPGKVRVFKGFAAVDKEEAAGGLAALVKSHGDHGAEVELLLGGSGKAREGVEPAAIATVPSKAAAGALEAVPADGGVHIVEKKAVGASEGVTLWDKALTFASSESPDVDAFEIRVPVGEQGDLDFESTGELVEKEAEGFGEALVNLERCGDAGEEVVLRSEVAAAVSQEGEISPFTAVSKTRMSASAPARGMAARSPQRIPATQQINK
jgi:molybdopterin biosynthesis enzyme MoaB